MRQFFLRILSFSVHSVQKHYLQITQLAPAGAKNPVDFSTGFLSLFSIVNDTALADHIDLDLSGIL